jgi:transposase-like protein
MIRVECPYCQEIVEVPKKWAIENQRLFCNSCCKSFEISIKSKEEEEPTDNSDSDYADGFYGL